MRHKLNIIYWLVISCLLISIVGTSMADCSDDCLVGVKCGDCSSQHINTNASLTPPTPATSAAKREQQRQQLMAQNKPLSDDLAEQHLMLTALILNQPVVQKSLSHDERQRYQQAMRQYGHLLANKHRDFPARLLLITAI